MDLDYEAISGLSQELQLKLSAARPATLAKASRIPGITPAALSLLLVHARKRPGLPQTGADKHRRQLSAIPRWQPRLIAASGPRVIDLAVSCSDEDRLHQLISLRAAAEVEQRFQPAVTTGR